ncbi:MAG: hypothetical protein D6B26_00025 [Spirochaetaceae bacterium]|nr:MAG: hypothetical protein D6B26_00025 [Spirochaetaceae bacterium]
MERIMMIRKTVLIAVLASMLGLFSLPGLSAQEFRFTTFVDYYAGIEPTLGYQNLRSRIYMAPEFYGVHDASGIEWKLSAKMWVQPLGERSVVDLSDILDEAYLLFPLGKLEIILGQKLLTYGFADIFGPLNVMHRTNRAPLSLDDGFEGRFPDPMVNIRFFPTFEDSLSLSYVPITRSDMERLGPVALPDTQDQVVWDQQTWLLDNPHSIFFNYSRYGEKFDMQVFYGWYTENTPDFQIETVDADVPVVIEPVYNKKHTLGVAYATRIIGGTLSQDIAFNLTSDLAGTDIGAQNSDLTVNTQYLTYLPGGVLSQFTLVYSWFPNHNGHDPGDDPQAAEYLAHEVQTFHTQPLEHIAFIVGHFERAFLRERLKTQLNVGFFFSPKLYIAPRLDFALNDHWTIAGGADINLFEPASEDLRRNPSNDNVYVRLLFRH